MTFKHLTTALFTLLLLRAGTLNAQNINVSDADTLQAATDSLSSDSTVKVLLVPSPDALDSKVEYKARDSMRFALKEKKIYLYGEADVKYEQIQLKAEYIEIDWNTNIVHAEGRPDSNGVLIGKPVFSEGAQTFDALAMDYNFKTKKGRISSVFTRQGEGYLHGDQVKRNEKDEFYVKNGKYTTCNLPEHPHFYINASRIKVIPKDKIVSGPANLVIEDVPTPLAVPFGIFPNTSTRSSGIIFPTYGESPGLGFFLQEGGYYFGINDYVDASLRGTIYSRGSWGLSGGTTYNYRYHYNGSFDMRYSKILQGDPELLGSAINKDFFITWRHNQDPKARPNSRFSASVQAGSSNYNALNSFNTNNIVSNTFQSSISYSKTFANTPFNMVVSAGHSQNTSTKVITVSAPEMQFNMNRFYPLKRKDAVGAQKWFEKIGITYTLQSRNTISLADSLYGRPGWTNKFNNGIMQSVPVQTSFQVLKYFTVTPAFNYTNRIYFSSIEKYFDESLGVVVTDTVKGVRTTNEWNASAALSTRVYSFLKPGKNTIRNVMTPQINYRYQPDFSSRIYGFYGADGSPGYYSPYDIGIYGQPAVGRQGTFGININNNIEGKFRSSRDTTGTGLSKISILDAFNFGTAYNIAADSLNWQPLSVSARTKLFKKLDVVYSSSYDFYAIDTASGLRVNRFQVNETGKLLRPVSANLALTTTLASGRKENLKSSSGNDAERNELMSNPGDYVDFTVPWSFNASFVLSRRYLQDEIQNNQVLNLSGDINLTEKWKIALSTGYDFSQKQFSFSTVDIFRDLHCWEMHFNWIPFGFRQSYNFTIRVKSSMLQDLKVNRRRQWFDLQNQ